MDRVRKGASSLTLRPFCRSQSGRIGQMVCSLQGRRHRLDLASQPVQPTRTVPMQPRGICSCQPFAMLRLPEDILVLQQRSRWQQAGGWLDPRRLWQVGTKDYEAAECDSLRIIEAHQHITSFPPSNSPVQVLRHSLLHSLFAHGTKYQPARSLL